MAILVALGISLPLFFNVAWLFFELGVDLGPLNAALVAALASATGVVVSVMDFLRARSSKADEAPRIIT